MASPQRPVPLDLWLPATRDVLRDVLRERAAQVARYGLNDDLEDGAGADVAWLAPITYDPATVIEQRLRRFYEDYEEEHGKPTWSLLVREELAEALQEDDPERREQELIQTAALIVSWVTRSRANRAAAQRDSSHTAPNHV